MTGYAMTKDEVIERLCETVEGLCEDITDVREWGRRVASARHLVWCARGRPNISTGRPAIRIDDKDEYAGSKDAYENATGYGIKWGQENG